MTIKSTSEFKVIYYKAGTEEGKLLLKNKEGKEVVQVNAPEGRYDGALAIRLKSGVKSLLSPQFAEFAKSCRTETNNFPAEDVVECVSKFSVSPKEGTAGHGILYIVWNAFIGPVKLVAFISEDKVTSRGGYGIQVVNDQYEQPRVGIVYLEEGHGVMSVKGKATRVFSDKPLIAKDVIKYGFDPAKDKAVAVKVKLPANIRKNLDDLRSTKEGEYIIYHEGGMPLALETKSYLIVRADSTWILK